MNQQMSELKTNVETIAKEQGKSPVEIISQLQTGAAAIEDEAMLEALCELKWEYIN